MSDVNRGLVAILISGLTDNRLDSSVRAAFHSQMDGVWAKGMLGPVGDWFWKAAQKYREDYHELLTTDVLKTMFEDIDPKHSEVITYYIQYALQADICTPGQFAHSINMLERAYGEGRFLHSLSTTITIFQTGLKHKGKIIKGFDSARAYLSKSLRLLESRGKIGEYENLRDAEDILIADPQVKAGIKYGFAPFDDLTGGGQYGELALVAGYTNEGKSQFLVNVVWNAVVMQCKNVVVYNGEMMPKQYKRRLVCRHSHHPKFNISGGLSYDDIKFGRLDESQFKKLQDVVADLKNNEDYGKVHIHGISQSDYAASICSSVESLSSTRIDMVVVDYLGLVPPSPGVRRGRREEMSETVRQFKKYAQSAYDGEGVYVLAAFQTNRAGRERAEENGFYDLRALEETAEAEKAADTIVWMLRTLELEETNEVKCGVMKARDSARLAEFYLYTDFASCFLSDVSA